MGGAVIGLLPGVAPSSLTCTRRGGTPFCRPQVGRETTAVNGARAREGLEAASIATTTTTTKTLTILMVVAVQWL
jgi:hypothetical protein